MSEVDISREAVGRRQWHLRDKWKDNSTADLLLALRDTLDKAEAAVRENQDELSRLYAVRNSQQDTIARQQRAIERKDAVLRNCISGMQFALKFVNSREIIKQPEGRDGFDDAIAFGEKELAFTGEAP